MEEFREKIIINLIETNDLLEKINSETKNGIEFLWEQAKNLVRIRVLIDETIGLDRNLEEHFYQDSLIIKLLGTSAATQKVIIEREGLEAWYKKFQVAIENFKDVIFIRYIYYFTYDTFSENSRDNDRKAKVLMLLANSKSALLEIGPGTGPLMRRLLRKGYNVRAIENDQGMINELLSKYPEARGRVINADLFKFDLGENNFDMIFIESGIFLFTRLSRTKIIFELFQGLNLEHVTIGFHKIYRALKRNGVFLIGIQGLMKKVDIGHGLLFEMKRTQLKDRAFREVSWYRKKEILSGKKLLCRIKSERLTIQFERFVDISREIGFSDIRIQNSDEWVILRK